MNQDAGDRTAAVGRIVKNQSFTFQPNSMKWTKITLLWMVFLTTLACSKEGTKLPVSSYLINDKGWSSYEFKRTDNGAVFTGDDSYLILNEYGDGLKFYENGTLKINYTDGISPIPDNSPIETSWEMINENIFGVNKQFHDNILVEIVEISQQDLWIKYQHDDILFEYKLKRIE
jgi:hypothetical protein